MSKAARPACMWLLVLSMTLGLLPTGAVQALAEEIIVLDAQEEQAEPELYEPELAPSEEGEGVQPEEGEELSEPDDGADGEGVVEVVPADDEDSATVEASGDDAAVVEDEAEENNAEDEAEENNAEDEAEENNAEDEADQPTTLKYEDDQLVVTAEAASGVLPEGATLEVEEIHPVTAEKADAYGEALSSLSEMLREEDKTYSAAHVYDIRILDADSTEIEPSGDVKVTLSYKQALSLGGVDMEETQVDEAVVTAPAADVAHLTNEGDLQMMGAEIASTDKGAVEAAEFTTDSFSYYIVFGTQAGSTHEPTNIGDYGWVKFATSGTQDTTPGQTDATANWGHYTELPALGTNEAFRRILQVNLWTKKSGYADDDYENGYEKVSVAQYFWTWSNTVAVDDFYLPGYEVVHTKMHMSYDDPANDRENDSFIDTYTVGGYQSSDKTRGELNTLDVYAKPENVPTEHYTGYVVRYVHADGSVSDGNLRYLTNGQTYTLQTADQTRTDASGNPIETYAGLSIITGPLAANVNESTGTGTIEYKDNVTLSKVYVYYKALPDNNAGTTTRGRYDHDEHGYYTGAKGLYTDKSATQVEGEGNERKFIVNLESWYVDNAASVGMVLDASGSMAWTAGEPTPIQKSSSEWDTIFGNQNWRYSSYTSSFNYHALTDAEVQILQNKGILDPSRTDNSSMGYNGYHYYIKSDRHSINEYVALGYTDGTRVELTNYVSGVPNNSSLYFYKLSDRPGYATRSRNLNDKNASNPANAGWYYVNSTGNTDIYLTATGKSYDGISVLKTSNPQDGSTGGGPSQFYIDNQGRLCCIFSDGRRNPYGLEGTENQWYDGNVVFNTTSPVYEKRETMFTKNETLQDSIAQFGSILLGSSPESQISMTRFSQTIDASNNRRFQNTNYLPLLNWTSDTTKVNSALDRTYNATGRSTAETTPVTTYQYGLTGQTRTWTGVKAYIDKFERSATATNHKYLVIFTDGKDTETLDVNDQNDGKTSDADRAGWGKTGARIAQLKNDGYTIITVLMKSQAMETSNEYTSARSFLEGLASKGKGGDENAPLYFEADSNSSHDMVEQFRQVANYISAGLMNYCVRDYIDPRFDVLNEAGDVISVLDENGNFTEGVENGFREFRTPDHKEAKLGYDAERKMFYVLWDKQTIPTTTLHSTDVNTWSSQIRLQAKEDFLGGNDVLTNGNELGENLVYKPSASSLLEPSDEYKKDSNGNYIVDDNGNRVKWEKSDFPFASVNPGLLDVALGNYEDTVFLGEEIKPGELLSVIAKDAAAKKRTDSSHRVADTVYNAETMNALGDTDQSSIWYVEYLERLGEKLHNNKDYYGTILQHLTLTGNTGVERLVTELENTSLYTFSTNNGVITATGKANTKAAGEKIIIDKNSAKITLELPYYYLESPTDSSTYAGRDRANAVDPQDDKVGTITYTWECKDFAGNVPAQDTKGEGNKFVSFDTYVSKTQHMDTTKAVQYQLGISYMPDRVLDAATGDDGSARTKALTGQTNVDQPLIRNAVGTEWTEAKSTGADQGWAVIHAVDGRILVEKRMLTADLRQMRADAPDASITLTLTGNNITSAPANEVVWTKTLAVSAATDLRVEGDYTYIVSEWATGLPQGAYTLTETVTDKFGTPVIEGVDNVAFWTLDNSDNDPAKPYADAPSTWKAAYSGSVTWNIGTANGTTCSYADTDYSYGMVEGDLAQATHKNVDPLLSANAGKAYLNAQLGRACVTNAPAKTSITVTKVWEGATPNAPIVIQLTGSDGTTRYAELNAGNSWSYTFAGLPINNTTYTAAEGTGTVTDETHASFSALETGAAGFDLDGKHYKQASVVYKDKDGATIAANQITGNVAPLAGSVTFTNQALTKVKVTKVWEGITPAQPIVIKLTSTDEADRYAVLSPDNNWTYTWEDLPVAANRTYAIVEGTGTIAKDGTCPDFLAFDTTADNFTFDNKTYRQKSLTYTPAGGTAGGTSLACVSPDSGAAKVINEALTKVEVKKEWAEGSIESPMVIELKDSDNNKTYVELNESNGYAHAFENLKVKEGLTYTVTEGTGTVNASDGTCAYFSAIEGVYTVRGEKMKRLSIEYYSNPEATTKATPQSLNGAISPYGGKAVVTNGPVQAKVTLKKVESTDHDKTIAGVTFNLLTGDDFATATAVATNPVTTGDDGTVDLGALKPGTYWLVEASAPDGYVLRDADDPIKLVVDDEGKATLGESIKPGSQYPAPELTQNENGEYELMVPNMRLYALPAAGGPGAYPFLLIGAFVAALSMSETFGDKKKRATAFGRHSQHGGKGWW